MNKLRIISILFVLFPTILLAQFTLTGGTNIGGSIPTTKTEGSSAVLIPGVYFGLSYENRISPKLSFQPSISADFKLFGYSAVQEKDTVVETLVLGITANVPTYYTANVNGKVRLAGVYLELPIKWEMLNKYTLSFGLYGVSNLYKSDEVNLNVRIGEGGLLPDLDSVYNNRDNINQFEGGLMLGGSYKINENWSVSITGYRSISRFYKMDAIKDDNGNDIPFYYTMARVGIRYSFNHPKSIGTIPCSN